MTKPDYKAKISGPYPGGWAKYYVEYYKYDDFYKDWSRIDSVIWTDSDWFHTLEKAEKIAKKRIDRWRKNEAAKDNFIELT